MMNNEFVTSRRKFLKLFGVTTACGFLLQEEWRATVLAEVSQANQPSIPMARLNLADFPTLAQDFGSVRVGTNRVTGSFMPVNPVLYPILINRGPGNQFYALNAACPHEGCVVPPYVKGSSASTCPCHGSRYRIDGAFVPGSGPANASLQQYTVRFDQADNVLMIELPDLPHTIDSISVQSGNARVQLNFFGLDGMDYQVLFRESVGTSWNPVSFSTTAQGALTLSTVTGKDQEVNVYAAQTGQTGFYAIALVLKKV